MGLEITLVPAHQKEGWREDMMTKIRQRLEDWMVAVAFAEQGDHLTAREFIRSGWRPRPAPRSRARRHNRMVAKAQAPRS